MIDLPHSPHGVVYQVEDYFHDNCKILKHDGKERNHIALVKDYNECNMSTYYYVIAYNNNGGTLVCMYVKKSLLSFNAMVIYEKIKKALNKDGIARMWYAMTHNKKHE